MQINFWHPNLDTKVINNQMNDNNFYVKVQDEEMDVESYIQYPFCITRRAKEGVSSGLNATRRFPRSSKQYNYNEQKKFTRSIPQYIVLCHMSF